MPCSLCCPRRLAHGVCWVMAAVPSHISQVTMLWGRDQVWKLVRGSVQSLTARGVKRQLLLEAVGGAGVARTRFCSLKAYAHFRSLSGWVSLLKPTLFPADSNRWLNPRPFAQLQAIGFVPLHSSGAWLWRWKRSIFTRAQGHFSVISGRWWRGETAQPSS
jgi:hypothetical protein